MIAEILVVYLEGKLVRMISMRVPMFMDVGLYLVGSLIICVRLRASSGYRVVPGGFLDHLCEIEGF